MSDESQPNARGPLATEGLLFDIKHDWKIIATNGRGAPSVWRCDECRAQAYGSNMPLDTGCTGPKNRTMTRDDF